MLSKWSTVEIIMDLESFSDSSVWSWMYFNKEEVFIQFLGTQVPEFPNVAPNYITQGLIKAKLTSLHISCLCAIWDKHTSWHTFCLHVIKHTPFLWAFKYILFTCKLKVTFYLASIHFAYLKQESFFKKKKTEVLWPLIWINQNCMRPGN